MLPRNRLRRRAFTLPELLVVVTITLILMSILVTATGIMTEAVTSAKSQGDLVSQERTALAILKRDLSAAHFLDEDGKPNRGRRVSDQRTDQLAVRGGRLAGWVPPQSGYFKAFSRAPQTNPFNAADPNTWNFDEGPDVYGSSSRSGNHFLQFTMALPGGAPEDTLTADVPFQRRTLPPNYTGYPLFGTAAEVAYFLVADGSTPTGVGKFRLVRRQRLAARTADDAPAYTALLNTPPLSAVPNLAADAGEVMAVRVGPGAYGANTLNVLNLSDLTLVANRFPTDANGRPLPIPAAPTGFRTGEDILLTNVISFEIKFTGPAVNNVLLPDNTTGQWPTPFNPAPPTRPNTDYPYDNLPFDGFYDTFSRVGNWSETRRLATTTNPGNVATGDGVLKPIRLTGASIRLRVWNPVTKKTRQTTIAVDL